MITGPDQDEHNSESMGFVDVSQDFETKATLTRRSTSTQNTEHADEVRSAIRTPQRSNCETCSNCSREGSITRTPTNAQPAVKPISQGPSQFDLLQQVPPPAAAPVGTHNSGNPPVVFNNPSNMTFVPGAAQPPPVQPPRQIQSFLPQVAPYGGQNYPLMGPPAHFNTAPIPPPPPFNTGPMHPFATPLPPYLNPMGNVFQPRVGPQPPQAPVARVPAPNVPIPLISPANNQMTAAAAPRGPPVAPPAKKEDFDLNKAVQYMRVGSDNPPPTSDATFSRTTSQHLRDIYADLNELAREAGAEPFDTTRVFLARYVQRLNLVHPTEWRLSLRIHSFQNGNIVMREDLLPNDEFPLYQFHKEMRIKRYPLFVLNYIGGRGAEIQDPEIVWGLNDVAQQLRELKAKIIREKAGKP